MTEINIASLVTQLQTLIDGLDLNTETTQNMLAYLKSAQLIDADAGTIVTELTSLIGAVATSEQIEQAVLLCVATSLITEDRELSVATTGDLPSTATAGSIYWVDSEGLPYIRTIAGTWTVIDPSLQPVALENAWSWGSNSAGRLGDGTITNRSSPVSVVGGFTDWTAISAGASHTSALRANGTAWAWGLNSFGRLGDGTVTSRRSPVSVVGGFTDWTDISAGNSHTAALRANGTAWAWGLNSFGRLGDGTITNRSSPVSVVGGFTDWTDISAGNFHTAALRANGSAWAWGYNGNGQVGDGTITNTSSPVSVAGGFTDWTVIAAENSYHTAALRANGTAWAWGYNGFGRLGDGTVTYRSSPVSVLGGFTDWTSISAGSNSTAALRANGTVWAWGRNSNTQVGDGTSVNRSSPVSVLGGFTDWTSISAGSSIAALRANGTAWAWGGNLYGQLGDGTTTARNSPVSVVGGFTDWTDISAGGSHTAALRTG